MIIELSAGLKDKLDVRAEKYSQAVEVALLL